MHAQRALSTRGELWPGSVQSPSALRSAGCGCSQRTRSGLQIVQSFPAFHLSNPTPPCVQLPPSPCCAFTTSSFSRQIARSGAAPTQRCTVPSAVTGTRSLFWQKKQPLLVPTSPRIPILCVAPLWRLWGSHRGSRMKPSTISEALLKGHVLTGEKCHVEGCLTPCMKSKDSGLYCPVHGSQEDSPSHKQNSNELTIPSGRQQQQSHSESAPTPVSREEAQAKLSSLMLEGWKLLGQVCPADGCSTPLLADKQGNMWCTAHNLWVVADSHAPQQQQQQSIEPSHSHQQQQSHSSASRTAMGNAPDSSTSRASSQHQQHQWALHSSQQASDTKQQREPHHGPATNSRTDFIAKASSTVVDKLCWAEAELAEETSEIERMKMLSSLIAELAHALSRLQPLNEH